MNISAKLKVSASKSATSPSCKTLAETRSRTKQNKYTKKSKMKTAKLLVFLFLISNNSFAQCYSKIICYSRNFIALQADGTLWSKGNGYGGFLGFGNNNPVASFTQIGSDGNWTENISTNGGNVFAIKTDGTLWVWGSNFQSGSTGLGTYDDLGYFTPTQVGTDTNWAKVTAGNAFTLAVKTDGTLWAWGSNSGGTLGIVNLDNSYTTNVPIQVGNETDWAKVYTGVNNLAYAIKTNGTLWSWGNYGNFIGYAGASDNNNYRTPHQVGTDNWATIAVSLGNPMTDGIKSDGSLWAWGYCDFQTYMFGNGIDPYSSQTPVHIGNDSDWKEVHLGSTTTIALKTNGTRWGWGRNSNLYQLGSGMIGDITVPAQLDLDTDWKTLNFDPYRNFGDGIKENNTLYHWGYDHLNVEMSTPTLFSATICTLGIEDFHQNIMIVYPNPIVDFTTIHLNNNLGSQLQVNIVNQLGQELLSKKIEIVNQEFTLNLSNYASGVYFLTLKNLEQTFKTKLIKN